MYVIDVDNVNQALPQAISLLSTQGQLVTSRGMQTVEMPGPVSTVYRNPQQRVLFDEKRDANPFFHLMEALWIIGGSNKVALPKYFMDSIDRFSDDGKTFHGAYGYRLRHAFGYDQLALAIHMLRNKPDTRQVVLSIWDGREDLGAVTKDLPCNDLVMLKVRNNQLNMTVCNRSNDAIWGAYGANVVQFSMLQEFIAASLDINVGHYVQQSDSFHAYTDNAFYQYTTVEEPYYWPSMGANPYHLGTVKPYPLINAVGVQARYEDVLFFQADCERLCSQAESTGDLLGTHYRSTYFQDVVVPVISAYVYYKMKKYSHAVAALQDVEATDWRLAMTQWVQRRADRAAAKEQA